MDDIRKYFHTIHAVGVGNGEGFALDVEDDFLFFAILSSPVLILAVPDQLDVFSGVAGNGVRPQIVLVKIVKIVIRLNGDDAGVLTILRCGVRNVVCILI